MEGPDLQFTEAVIDNGALGRHVVRFESGLLARQAAGSATVYLDDDTMVLSATTAQNKPREAIDFFPLTVDVEERMYAAGRIPGSFFRREGRPSEGAILTCRLIDRPLRPCFVKGLRNEVQVVVTVMALNPDKAYDVVAINAASLSTQLAGLPFSGPVGGVRVALIGDQWVGFPDVSQLEQSTFDMVVAGRVTASGEVAIAMVEAESTEQHLGSGPLRRDRPDRRRRRGGSGGGQAVHLRPVRRPGRARRPVPQDHGRVPDLPGLPGRRVRGRVGDGQHRAGCRDDDRRQAGPRGGDRDPQGQGRRRARTAVRGSREGDHRRLPVVDQGARPEEDPRREGAHRRPRGQRHPHPVRRGRRGARGCTVRRSSSAARPRSWASPP